MSTSRATWRRALPWNRVMHPGAGGPERRRRSGAAPGGIAGGRERAGLGARRVALVAVVLCVATAAAARGVLVERPVERTGIELFPDRLATFYEGEYEFNGVLVTVAYTRHDVPYPDPVDTRTCGGEQLLTIHDRDYAVRVLSIGDELIFFRWEAGGEFEVCEYIGAFAERYRFFRDTFTDDPYARLPAVVESE